MKPNRKTFIGGSDIAAIMGMSRWKSPLQLWAEKTGTLPEQDLSDNEAVELGTELEDFVAKKFTRKTGLKVRQAPQIYVHKDYDYFKCQVDRLVTNTNELLEVKTTSAWKVKEWAGEEIPQEYILQVNWQLGITGRDKGWLAVLIGGQKFRTKEMMFDKKLFDKQIEMALGFWVCVQNKTAPMATGIDNPFMIELNPTHNDTLKEADDEMNTKIGLLMETKFHIDQLKETQDLVEAQIKQVIGDSLGIKTSQYSVTWKQQARSSVDTEKLKDDNLYEKYQKLSSTRVLRVKKGETNGNA